MKVSELGEAGIINLLRRMIEESRDNSLPAWQKLLVGIGDDAAAWQGDATINLAKTDSLREDIHFIRGLFPWRDLGWKALAINLSDIAAMGALPRYALVSISLPGEAEVEEITALYQGLLECAKQYGVAIIGGDTDRAPRWDITVMLLGATKTPNQTLLLRSAARPGDKVAVTGYLGSAAACVKILKGQMEFEPEKAALLKKALFHPTPRIPEGQLLVAQGVKAAIDISDGLVLDLGHICQSSKVGARVELEKVPVEPVLKEKLGSRALELALAGGEDYELLFTAPNEMMKKVNAAGCPVHIIGEITGEPGKIALVDKDGKLLELSRTGWDHFARK
jgi:thiamine-monophosphate kinase